MHIHGCQEIWAIHIPKSENRTIHILSFFKKRVFIIYLAALKIGLIGTHIRTMSYIGSYPSPGFSFSHTQSKDIIQMKVQTKLKKDTVRQRIYVCQNKSTLSERFTVIDFWLIS